MLSPQFSKKFSILILCIALTQFTGIIGSFFTVPNIDTWYQTLTKPWFQPPSWVFAPVWSILYLLIGIALFLILRHWRSQKKLLILFLCHLLLNGLWSIIFFGWHMIGLALFDIIVMDITLVILMMMSKRYDKKIIYLLTPSYTTRQIIPVDIMVDESIN